MVAVKDDAICWTNLEFLDYTVKSCKTETISHAFQVFSICFLNNITNEWFSPILKTLDLWAIYPPEIVLLLTRSGKAPWNTILLISIQPQAGKT